MSRTQEAGPPSGPDAAGQSAASEHYARGLARAAGGALLFSTPLLMTMEMWWLGFHMDRFRLALLVVLTLAMLARLSWYAGFEENDSPWRGAADALAAFAVGVVITAAVLFCFAELAAGMGAAEVVGKVALQAVPAALGAMVARRQLGSDDGQSFRGERGYGGELFLMGVGAVYFSFNVAPTQEMTVIAYQVTHWHALALVLLSLLLLHAFVYTVGFAGQEEPPGQAGFWLTFLQYTLAGYAIALLVSLYMLWSFERTDGASLAMIARMTVVLGFPASVGAAVARLVV